MAFGFKYDIAPAQEVGMQTAWINRHREPREGDVEPDHEWRDLWGLAELRGGSDVSHHTRGRAAGSHDR